VTQQPSASGGSSRLAPSAAVASFVIWGIVPLLFQALAARNATSVEILAHRGFWAIFFSALFVTAARQWPDVARVLREPKTLALLALSAAAVSCNWLIFIWAVNHGQTLDASLGYYINPLLNMAIGAVLYRERIDRLGMVAVALALVGVVIQTFALGHPPVVAIALALSFAVYGVIRRGVRADAQTGLFIECLVIGVPAFLYIVWLERSGGGQFLANPGTAAMLAFTGLSTATPLVLFAWAARRISFSLLGFLQFVGPTIQFAVGYLEGESFTPLRALSFAFIWAGVACFIWGAWKTRRARLQA
jgi:chloramphenicol-sensitive protein RarD